MNMYINKIKKYALPGRQSRGGTTRIGVQQRRRTRPRRDSGDSLLREEDVESMCQNKVASGDEEASGLD